MHTFTLIVNAGRSGSTYLEHVLTENYAQERYVAHEDIPVQISRPRSFNRAYTPDKLARILADDNIGRYFTKWQAELKSRSVIETGWTAYHLCPVLSHLFGERFRYVILHRDPVSFALSRANMGNYHPKTFYDDAHELSPFDEDSVAPEYRERWGSMNHFEKCMFWWYVVYSEAYEFRRRRPEIPVLELRADDVFVNRRLNDLLSFLGLDPARCARRDTERNEVARFMKETFPVRGEWKRYSEHPSILRLSESMGYVFRFEEVEERAQKYGLPKGFLPAARHWSGYWRMRSRVGRLLRT